MRQICPDDPHATPGGRRGDVGGLPAAGVPLPGLASLTFPGPLSSAAMLASPGALGQPAEPVTGGLAPQARAVDLMKFSMIAAPCAVRMDSGWNWTPSIGRVACRSAIGMPSVRAVTSR
jgi:hypothetical protein